MMVHMLRDHESWVANDGNHVMVPNLNEMISTIAPMISINIFLDLNLNAWWPLGVCFSFHGMELPNIMNDFIIV